MFEQIILVEESLFSTPISTSSYPWSWKDTSEPSTLVPLTERICAEISVAAPGTRERISGIMLSYWIFSVDWTLFPPPAYSALNDSCGDEARLPSELLFIEFESKFDLSNSI